MDDKAIDAIRALDESVRALTTVVAGLTRVLIEDREADTDAGDEEQRPGPTYMDER